MVELWNALQWLQAEGPWLATLGIAGFVIGFALGRQAR